MVYYFPRQTLSVKVLVINLFPQNALSKQIVKFNKALNEKLRHLDIKSRTNKCAYFQLCLLFYLFHADKRLQVLGLKSYGLKIISSLTLDDRKDIQYGNSDLLIKAHVLHLLGGVKGCKMSTLEIQEEIVECLFFVIMLLTDQITRLIYQKCHLSTWMDDVDFFNADNHENNKETETSILYGCGQV